MDGGYRARRENWINELKIKVLGSCPSICCSSIFNLVIANLSRVNRSPTQSCCAEKKELLFVDFQS